MKYLWKARVFGVWAAVVAAWGTLGPGAAHAAATLPDIRPVPQHVEWSAGTPDQIDVGVIGSVVVSPSIQNMQGGIAHLSERLAEIGRSAMPVAASHVEPGTPGTLYLGLKSDRAWPHVVWLPSPNVAEGYRLIVGDDSIILVGEDEAGVYYGLTTLRQMIEASGAIKKLAVMDWPLMPFRGVHMVEYHDTNSYVRQFALGKANTIITEAVSLYQMHDPGIRAVWQNTQQLCRDNHIEFVPQLQTMGWGHAALTFEPRAVEGSSALRVRFRVTNGVLVSTEGSNNPGNVPPLTNVVLTEASPLTVRSEDMSVTYVEGVDYEVEASGPLRYPFNQAPLPVWTVRTLPGSAMQENQIVRVDYTYARFDDITNCPSEPVYQDLMRNAIHNVVEHLNPRYIHLGHDEPRVMRRDRRCTSRGMTSAQLFAENITNMHAYAKEADPNVRIMIWDDAINPYHNAGRAGLVGSAEMIPKDVVINMWRYGYNTTENNLIDQTAAYFLNLGFDATGSPWYLVGNARHWGETMLNYRQSTPRAKGLLYTSWLDDLFSTPWVAWEALDTTLEYAWSGARTAVVLAEPLDSNKSGVPNYLEGTGDLDDDGIPDWLDLDIDGDGVSNAVELGLGLDPYDPDDGHDVPATGRTAAVVLAVLGGAALWGWLRRTRRTAARNAT